jgi:GNAT superfamily N-acetyltransferase
MVVEDDFQDRGIGRLLYRRLAQLARQRGLTAFTGDVHYENERVLELMRRNRNTLHLEHGLATMRFIMRLDSGPELPSAA